MTREERIAEIAEWARAEYVDEAGCFFEYEYENVNYLITELRAADEELKKLRAATGVYMVCELLALANRKLTEMTARHDAAVDRLSLLTEKLQLAKDALDMALYDLVRIRDADWEAEQMRMGARSGAHVLSESIKKLEALK